MQGTDWTSGLIALALGLVAGLIFWLRFRKASSDRATVPATTAQATELADLRARRDTLMTRLRELEGDDAVAVAEERTALELEAATVLRSLRHAEQEASRPAPAVAASPAGGGFFATRPAVRGFLWGAGSASFLFVLLFFLLDIAADRAPGGSPTGNTPMGTGTAGGMPIGGDDAPDPELDQVRAYVAAHPEDLETKLDLAQALLFRERLLEAFNVVQEVTKVQPQNPRAITYEGVVRLAMGQQDRAIELLDQAVRLDPQLTEAWVRRGLAAFEMGRYQDAIDSWERALEQRPDGSAALNPVIAEARARLAGGGSEEGRPSDASPDASPAAAATPGAGALPQGHPPASGATVTTSGATDLPPTHPPADAAAPTAAAASAREIRLQIELGPSVAGSITPGSVLFVSVRPAGVTAGPPVAARRIPVGAFPLELTIGDGDTMMGQPFPESAFIEVRVDRDGNAMTRDADDPVARIDGARAGGEPILLELRAP